MSRILIADDQNDVLEALRILLKGEGHQTDAVTSLAGVFQALEKKDYALLIMDLNYTRDTTSGQEGLEVIPRIQALDNTLPIVVMTAWATIDLAVEAMKLGARDFIPKPWDNDRLLAIVRTQIELAGALRKGRRLEAANQLLRGNAPNLIAESPRMRPVLELISRVAPSDANVLITGENGTGKGLVAQALHALSPRASHSMITVNMGGLSEGIFESELFGHVKGAFTDAKTDRAGRFELADESTLFMDEIANVPMNQQAKLLRMIETGEFERVGSSKTLHANVRIISATNANPHEEVAAGRFRQDFLFRLNTIEIALPPLRERREDIMLLADSFLRQHAKRYRKTLTGFEEAARDVLMQHQYPGNVRELDHVVERAVLMTQGQQVKANDLGLTSRHARLAAAGRHEPGGGGIFPDQEGALAFRRKRAQGGGSIGAEPERVLSPAPAVWAVRVAHASACCDRLRAISSCRMLPRKRLATRKTAARALPRSTMKTIKKLRQRITHEGRLTWLTLCAAAPAFVVALALLWFGDHTAKVQWTLTLLIAGFALGFILSAREHVIRPLQTMTNLLAALREGDYSIRARGARADDALGEAMLEINALGETLRFQRLGAFEATALLRTIMAEIDVAVFTFDPDRRLRLVNRAGEDLLGQPMDKVLGRRARDIGLEVCLDANEDAPLTLTFPGRLRTMGRAAKFFSRTRPAP